MADRTSAGIFGQIFELLAEDPTEDHKALALRVYDMTRGYDFNDYQMNADEALETLGLVDPDGDEDDAED